MKKLFFVFTVIFCMTLCIFSCWAENIALSVDRGDAIASSTYTDKTLTWSVDHGVLTISGTGDMPSYTDKAAPWNNSAHHFEKVVISEGITSVGDYAFHLRSSVYQVSLPTTLQRIGKYAFAGCSIMELSFPYGLQSIGESAYANCPFLTLVSIPSTLTSLSDSAFSGCSSLSAIYVDLANPVFTGHDGVLYNKDMTRLLKYPASRQASEFTVPATVTTLAPYTFANSKTLQSIILHDGMTEIAPGCFAWCEALSSVDFPDHLASIGDYAFYYCTALTELTLPQSLTKIGHYAFGGCDNVTAILYHGTSAQWDMISVGHNYILTVIPIQHNYRAASEITYDITVLLNGEKLVFDTEPLIKDNRTLVPMRAIFEAFGAAVLWEPTTKTVTASRQGTKITLQIDSPMLKINDAVLVLDVPAQIIENRTYVPLRAISECLSCTIDWDGETKTVMIKDN